MTETFRKDPSQYCECCQDHVDEPVADYLFPDNSINQMCDSCAKYNI